MKIFVCEFITGGGLYREPLPPSLAREGLLMRDALLRDLAELADVEVTVSCDRRLPLPQSVSRLCIVDEADDIWEAWNGCIASADAVWLIAPETGGILLQLTEAVTRQDKTVLGCAAQAVRLASSKIATFAVLRAAGIEAVPTYRFDQWPEHAAPRWVAKPDDGAGCADSRYFDNAADLRQWMQGRETTHVIQPYLPGTAASLCVLCDQGQAWLLSCNVQKIMNQSGSFSYAGSTLNGAAQHWRACESLVTQVAQAIPGLSGYVGIDILIDAGQPCVLEINPRLTTSYAGLHQAMACNPARLVIDLLYNGRLPLPDNFSRNVVQIELDDAA